jgi:hypothetical protein
MTDTYDSFHQTAEKLSAEVNTPSTSAMESNENDIHLKTDPAVVQEINISHVSGQTALQETNDYSEAEAGEQPPWFETVRGAALTAKESFPDQLDYYDSEKDEIV